LKQTRDPALTFIGTVAVIASIVLVGGAVWLFSNGEPQGAWVIVIILILGYAAMGAAKAYANRKG
jgi:hypothetical protein